MRSLNDWYRECLTKLVNAGVGTEDRFNHRTRQGMMVWKEPQTFSTHYGVLVPRWRRLAPHVPFADMVWQMMATPDLTWLNTVAGYIWGPYAQDNQLLKAYGVRWWWQIDSAMVHLKADSSSRQVYVSTWDPRDDCALAPSTPMPPCILGFHLQIDAYGALAMSVLSRSCDIIIGFPHDLMNLQFLHAILANELNRKTGLFSFTTTNLHLYRCHQPQAENMTLANWLPPLQCCVPETWKRQNIINPAQRDDLVKWIRWQNHDDIHKAPHIPFAVTR